MCFPVEWMPILPMSTGRLRSRFSISANCPSQVFCLRGVVIRGGAISVGIGFEPTFARRPSEQVALRPGDDHLQVGGLKAFETKGEDGLC